MAPPRKKRRLSQSPLLPHDITSTPTPTHDANTTTPRAEATGARSVPQRIEEIHLQIQRHALPHTSAPSNMHRRGLSGSDSIPITVDSALSSATPVTSLPSSISPSPTSGAATTGSSSIAPSSNLASGAANATSSSPSSSILPSNSRNATHTSHSTTLPITYVATLTNSNRRTITRNTKPYATTFGDGQTSTICDRFGQCQMSTDQTPLHSITSTAMSEIFQTPTFTTPFSSATVFVASPITTPAPTTSLATSGANHQGSDPPPAPPGTIAGGVVGGAAGIAIVLLVTLVLVRWYKRNSQNKRLALPDDPNPPHNFGQHSNQSGMMERAGLSPLMHGMPAFFRHHNKSVQEPAPSERGFTKISGRKLPSAFSEGLTRDEIAAAAATHWNQSHPIDLTGTSFFRDSSGHYGGNGDSSHPRSISPDLNPFADSPPDTAWTLSPGPQRRPNVHAPGPYLTSTGAPSPLPSPSAQDHQQSYPPMPGRGLYPYTSTGGTQTPPQISRSGTPTSESRSTRFAENV